MLHGSINHVSLTVSDLEQAMSFLGPLLELLGYEVGEIAHDPRSGHDLTVNGNRGNGKFVNVWQADETGAGHPFAVYEPGLHHVAFNVSEHDDVDRVHALVNRIGGKVGGTVLDGPAEFPFGLGGYYAVYFTGPDGIKFEVVHMPGLERAYDSLRLATDVFDA